MARRLSWILLLVGTMTLAACDGSVLGQQGPCASGPCEADGATPPEGGQYSPPDSAPPPPTPDGAVCQGTVCGSACCTKDQICQSGACAALGPKCDELWPCPKKNQACDKTLGRCVTTPSKCEYRPPPGVFSPKVEWEWTGSKVEPGHNQVMMTPMVANLTDDNKDGKIDRNDVPDIVFNTFSGGAYTTNGVLRVISGDGSKEHFAVTAAGWRTRPGTEVAIADIDNDHKPEIVACASGGGVMVFEHDGKPKWKKTGVYCYAPAIADLHGDGSPEIIVSTTVLASTSGNVIWKGAVSGGAFTTVADIYAGTPGPEIIGGNVVYTRDGKILWHDKKSPSGTVAIADLDKDGSPEIITAASGTHSLYAHRASGKLYWGPVDINQGVTSAKDKCGNCGGGPPTIADFDGDGYPEIAAAGGYGYVVFEHDGKPKWFSKTQDLSSRVTGSSVFDFEGDGKAEVVYGDELVLRIYQGSAGKVLFSHCNTSGTLYEYPVIVDVDNDGHAEIVVANNNYAFKTCGTGGPASHTGIKVLGDTKNNWVRTRRIWNQHTYHVTNVDEDGRVPKQEPRNWLNPNLNNFRQNVQPGGLFDAPDLMGAADKAACGTSVTATVKVINNGAAKVMPGVKVTLYVQTPTGALPLQTVATKTAILPGQTEVVAFAVKTPKDFASKKITLYALVDSDAKAKGTINECREGNNKAALGQVHCKTIF